MTIITDDHSHFSHNHYLKLVSPNVTYRCNGCMELGAGARYNCGPCDFDLHKACMFYKSTNFHPFYEKSCFKFFDHPPGEHVLFCEACGRDIKGFVYFCKERGIGLHPHCFDLPLVMKYEGKKLHMSKDSVSKCCYCEMKNQRGDAGGWSYALHKNNFLFRRKKHQFHVSCITEMIAENWKNKKMPALSSMIWGKRKYRKIASVVFQTVSGILLGNPLQVVSSIATSLN